MKNNDLNKYDDLIDHTPPRAMKPMPLKKRAAQFAPYAALVGFEGEVKETARLTDREITYSESEMDKISMKLQILSGRLNDKPYVTVKFYVPDIELNANSKKEGGTYRTYSGIIKKIEPFRCVQFLNGPEILICRILEIECDILPDFI